MVTHALKTEGSCSLSIVVLQSFKAIKQMLSGYGQRKKKNSFHSDLLADSRCSFTARGLDEDPGISVNDASIVFPNVSLNACKCQYCQLHLGCAKLKRPIMSATLKGNAFYQLISNFIITYQHIKIQIMKTTANGNTKLASMSLLPTLCVYKNVE